MLQPKNKYLFDRVEEVYKLIAKKIIEGNKVKNIKFTEKPYNFDDLLIFYLGDRQGAYEMLETTINYDT